MSIFYIKGHNECIYNISKKPEGGRTTVILPKTKRNVCFSDDHLLRLKHAYSLSDHGSASILSRYGRLATIPEGRSLPLQIMSNPQAPLRYSSLREQEEKLKHKDKNIIKRNIKNVVNVAQSKNKPGHNECIYNISTKPEGGRTSGMDSSKESICKQHGRNVTEELRSLRRKQTAFDPDIKYLQSKLKRKPSVPTRDIIKEQDEKLKHEPVDILKRNMGKAVTTKRRNPAAKIAEASKLSHTAAYGNLPNYIDKIRRKKQDALLKHSQMSECQPKCRYFIRDYRKLLLEGLKVNWQELQAQYQQLPILTDTIPKINYKAQIEANMRQLERDIVLVERHPYIYVYDDNDLD